MTSTTAPQQPKPLHHAVFGERRCRKHCETRRFCAQPECMLRARLPEARASQATQRTRIDHQTRMESDRASQPISRTSQEGIAKRGVWRRCAAGNIAKRVVLRRRLADNIAKRIVWRMCVAESIAFRGESARTRNPAVAVSAQTRPAVQQKRPRKPQAAQQTQERPRGSSKSRKTRVFGKGGAQKASQNARFGVGVQQETSQNALFCDGASQKTSQNNRLANAWRMRVPENIALRGESARASARATRPWGCLRRRGRPRRSVRASLRPPSTPTSSPGAAANPAKRACLAKAARRLQNKAFGRCAHQETRNANCFVTASHRKPRETRRLANAGDRKHRVSHRMRARALGARADLSGCAASAVPCILQKRPRKPPAAQPNQGQQ